MAISQESAQAVQTGAPAAGAAIGTIWGPIGSLIGAAAGTVIGQGVGLFAEGPEIPGPSAQQQQVLNLQMANLERAQSQSGMSAAQVNKIQQAQVATTREQLAALTTTTQMSPLDRQRMQKALINLLESKKQTMGEQILSLDERVEAQRIANVTAQSQAAAINAQAIQEQKLRQEQMLQAIEVQRVSAFNQNINNMVEAIGGAMEYQALQDAEQAKQQDINVATQEIASAQTRVASRQKELEKIKAGASSRANQNFKDVIDAPENFNMIGPEGESLNLIALDQTTNEMFGR